MGPNTPLQRVVQTLLGGEMFFEPAGRAKPLLRAMEDFATANPLKRQLLRWEALTKEHKIAAQFRDNQRGRFDESSRRGQDENLKKAVRELAEEEQVSLSWHLVRAVLEEDPVKRGLLADLVRARSPLSAGVLAPEGQEAAVDGATAGSASRDAHGFPGGVAVAGNGPSGLGTGIQAGTGGRLAQEPKPEELAAFFLKMLADPAVRQRLEPAGAMAMMVNQSGTRDAFLLSLQRGRSAWAGTAELLMKEHDSLAARLAVILMARQGQPEVSAEWVAKGLKAFPEDPELLLASAALEAQRGGGGEPPEAARGVLLKGLSHLGPMIPFDRDTYPVWCGVDAGMLWGGLETAQALAAFVDRAQPESIPQNWVQVMESTLRDSAQLRQLTEAEARSMVMAVVRHKARWRLGEGSPQGWMALLDSLKQADRSNLAAEAAEVLLSEPTGSLGFPGAPAEPAPPWNNSNGAGATGPGAEGWKWLLLAERGDPAGLAKRLRAVAAAHPGDEQTAFAALLAQGRVRELTAEDLKELLTSLTPAGRQRALAYAGCLLPQDRLPVALLLDSWEAEAVVEFSDVGNGSANFQQGNRYLDRLEEAGAADAVRRVLPNLVESVRTLGGFPLDFPGSIFHRLERFDQPELAKRLQAILVDLLKRPAREYGLQHNQIVAAALAAQAEKSAPAELPAELVSQVTAALEGRTATPAVRRGVQSEEEAEPPPTQELEQAQTPDQQNTDQNAEPASAAEQKREAELERKRNRYLDFTLINLAWTTAGDVRWHDALRKLLADRPDGLDDRANRDGFPSWQALELLLGVMDSGRVIPDLDLEFSPGSEGQGTLSWRFDGLMPPPLTDQERMNGRPKIPLPWPTLAASLAGKFDALVMVADDNPTNGERLAARIENLPAEGEMALTGLPSVGRLRLLLIRREAPQITAETDAVVCNTLPVLLDSAKPPGPQTRHPADWRLLSEPSPLGDAEQWQVLNSSPTAAWPQGVALLMLDDAGEVCAIADLGIAAQRRSIGYPGNPTASIGRHQFNAAPIRSGDRTALRVTGTPVRLGLGVSTRPSVMSGEDPADPSRRLPRLTVHRDFPPPVAAANAGGSAGGAAAMAAAGRMEIVRTWHLPATPRPEGYSRADNPVILRNPSRAVWYDDGELVLIDLEKPEPVSRSVKLDVPPRALLSGLQWTGTRVCLLFQSLPENSSGAGRGKSLLFSIDPNAESPPAKPVELPAGLELVGFESIGIPGVMSLRLNGSLHGILTVEGQLLTLPTPTQAPTPSPNEGPAAPPPVAGNPQYAVSPTRIALYSEKDGEFPVVDWSDGTLRVLTLTEREPVLQPQPRSGESITELQSQDRWLVHFSAESPRYWHSPLSFQQGIESLGDGQHFLGRVLDNYSMMRDLVLLRQLPAEKPQSNPATPSGREP